MTLGLKRLNRLLLVALMSIAVSTVVGVRGAEPAMAAACYGYVHNLPNSSDAILAHTKAGMVELEPGETAYGEPGNPVYGFALPYTRRYAAVQYYHHITDANLGVQRAAGGLVHGVDLCHEAYVLSPEG